MAAATIEEVGDQLDDGFQWRRSELFQIRSQIETLQPGPRQRTLLRAGVALMYAHWEGYVKEALQTYVDFVAMRRLTFAQLNDTFVALGVRGPAAAAANGDLAAMAKLVEWCVATSGSRADLPRRDIINTRSNLSSAVLQGLLSMLGLDGRFFETKSQLLDRELLDTRNAIAHGRDRFPAVDTFMVLYDQVLSMMSEVRRLVLDAVAMGRYRRKAD